MAFKAPKKSPQFADLKGILAQTKETDNPLYQVVELIIERLTQLKLVTPEEIEAAVEAGKPKEKPLEKHAPTHMPGGTDILPVTNAGVLLGRGAISPGPIEHISLGTGLAMSGSTLNASGGVTPGPHGTTHQASGSDKIPVSAGNKLLGRDSSGPGDMQELALGAGLVASGGFIDIGAIPETAIIDGTLLARNAANEVITGNWTFTGPAVTLSNLNPQMIFIDADASADNKVWRYLANGNTFLLQTMNDAQTAFSSALEITRAGNVVDSFKIVTNNVLRTAVNAIGNLIHTAGLILSGISTPSIPGSTSAFDTLDLFMIDIYVASSVNIHGMVPKASGYTCVLLNRHDSSGNIGLINMEPSAPTAYKIACPGNISFVLVPGAAATLYWNGAFGHWKVIGTNFTKEIGV